MKNMRGVLQAINVALEVPEGSRSSIEELSRHYDPDTTEYVYTLQYRVFVPPKPITGEPDCIFPLIASILDRLVQRSRWI